MGKSIGAAWGTVTGGLSGGLPGSIAGNIAGGKVGQGLEDVTGVSLTGMFDDETNQSSVSRVMLRDYEDLIKGRSQLEADASGAQLEQFGQLRDLLTRGGTAQAGADIDAARGAQLDLAAMLKAAQGGPSNQNILDAQGFANKMFAPQELALQQNYQQASTDTSRLAARLGRQVDDPILRAKLAESQGQQTAMLGAQKGAFTAQQAQSFQQQALGMQNQLAQVRGGLATQALQNRQALMGMGQSLINQERQFRLNTATRTGNAQTVSPGGIGDVIGAIGGIGGLVGKFAGMG